MRETRYFGNAHGAKIVEARKGRVDRVVVGDMARTEINDEGGVLQTTTFHPRHTVTGETAKYLAGALFELALAHGRGEIATNAYYELIDGAILGKPEIAHFLL